jgi:hypothetical protein
MSGVASGLDVTQYVAVLNQTFAMSFQPRAGFPDQKNRPFVTSRV